METESEPYVRLSSLRQLHRAVARLNAGRSLADTLQTIADGAVDGLGWDLAAVNLVRPEGDLVVAAVAGSPGAEAMMAGRVGSRESWDRRLGMGEPWGTLRFVPYTEGWVLDDDDVPQWHSTGPSPHSPDAWHPMDRLFAPLYASAPPPVSAKARAAAQNAAVGSASAVPGRLHGAPGRPLGLAQLHDVATGGGRSSAGLLGAGPDDVPGDDPGARAIRAGRAAQAAEGELLGVLSVDKPRNGKRPGAWAREALQMYSAQAAIALSNARLRSNMQRALVRLEREQSALRASEESFRQAFEYAPSGMAVAEMGGDHHGRLIRINDALCRLLGRPASAMRRYAFSDLVHPEDMGTLLRTSAEGGRAELRLARRDGSYVWVSLRNSVVADTADGPRFLLTHVEDIEERKRHELQLAHRASHDSLTGLPNSAELRARLNARLCDRGAVGASDVYDTYVPPAAAATGHGHIPEPAYDGYDARDGFDGQDGPPEPYERYDRVDGYTRGATMPAASPHDPHHVHAVQPRGNGRGEKGLAVLFCDLDGFKSINDRFGHNCGDAVLVEVARRLSAGVRDNDTVARMGGDEFVILADGLGLEDAQDLAVRLRNGIIPPIRVDGRAVRVGASFGIGWAECGMTAEEILQSADQRMYMEKRSRAKGQRRAG